MYIHARTQAVYATSDNQPRIPPQQSQRQLSSTPTRTPRGLPDAAGSEDN